MQWIGEFVAIMAVILAPLIVLALAGLVARTMK